MDDRSLVRHLPARCLVAALALAGLLAAPAASQASDVLVGGAAPAGGGLKQLRVYARPGERNQLTITRVGTSARGEDYYEVTDSGADMTAGARCSLVNSHDVRCAAAPVGFVLTDLKDGDDAIVLDVPVGSRVYGREGNDGVAYSSTSGVGGDQPGLDLAGIGELRTVNFVDGGPGEDRLIGSNASDQLLGGPGADSLVGQGAADYLDGGPGGDLISGGSSSGDVVSYATRTKRVGVFIDGVANDGEKFEGDNVLPDVEGVIGGGGDDRISGPSTPNAFIGGAGNDRLDGGAGPDRLFGGPGDDGIGGQQGDDELSGGPGADLLEGGSGNDAVEAGADHREDRADCGPGADVVYARKADSLTRCEREFIER